MVRDHLSPRRQIQVNNIQLALVRALRKKKRQKTGEQVLQQSPAVA